MLPRGWAQNALKQTIAAPRADNSIQDQYKYAFLSPTLSLFGFVCKQKKTGERAFSPLPHMRVDRPYLLYVASSIVASGRLVR